MQHAKICTHACAVECIITHGEERFARDETHCRQGAREPHVNSYLLFHGYMHDTHATVKYSHLWIQLTSSPPPKKSPISPSVSSIRATRHPFPSLSLSLCSLNNPSIFSTLTAVACIHYIGSSISGKHCMDRTGVSVSGE